MLIHRAARFAKPVIHVTLLLVIGSLLFPAAAPAGPGRPRAAAEDALPHGLVVVIKDDPKQDQLDLRALDNPSIRGVALQIRWRDMEPVEGKPDWSKLDQLFAGAEAKKKWVHLLLFPGFWSPPWAIEGTQSAMFAIQYGPGKGGVERLPLPWDTVYLNRWFAFVKLVSERYGKSPALRLVATAGPTSVSAEFTLPNKPEDIQKWRSVGYTPTKYIDAWQKAFQVYAADFPNQFISLSTGSGLNIDERGQKDARERIPTKEALIDEGIRLLGRRFVLQNSNLDGNPEPERGPHGVPLVISYNGRVITGLQMRTSCLHNSGDMGAEGNPPLALKKAINRGLEPNGSGHHVNYVEIYAPDVMAEEMQPVLQDTATRLP